MRGVWGRISAHIPGRRGIDASWIRALVVDANDGIIATAGVIEGLLGAGVPGRTIRIAALVALLAGGIALAGVQYAEAASERDAQRALLDYERRRLERSPEEELAELTALYEARGLPPELADHVARELTARDALAAHAEIEYGISAAAVPPSPLATGVSAAAAFAAGAAIPTVVVSLARPSLRIPLTAAAVLLSLAATSVILARAGRTGLRRTITRTVLIGLFAMAVTTVGGAIFAAAIDT